MTSKIILIGVIIFLSSTVLKAQDVIKLKNGLTLTGYITEVNSNEIKFRIDGGIVTMDQVISYQKAGESPIVKSQNSPSTQTITTTPSECEIKNVGDVEFENKSKYTDEVIIYAIGIAPSLQTENPEVARITVAPQSKASSYELTTGTHYIVFGGGSGQIRITKCGTTKFILQ